MSKANLLTREALLSAPTRRYITVRVPHVNQTARLQSMTGSERDAAEAAVLTTKGRREGRDLRNFRARIVAYHLVDDKDERMFDPRSKGDLGALGRIDGMTLDFLFEKSCELSGISDGDVDDMTEDFDDAQPEDSTSS